MSMQERNQIGSWCTTTDFRSGISSTRIRYFLLLAQQTWLCLLVASCLMWPTKARSQKVQIDLLILREFLRVGGSFPQSWWFFVWRWSRSGITHWLAFRVWVWGGYLPIDWTGSLAVVVGWRTAGTLQSASIATWSIGAWSKWFSPSFPDPKLIPSKWIQGLKILCNLNGFRITKLYRDHRETNPDKATSCGSEAVKASPDSRFFRCASVI